MKNNDGLLLVFAVSALWLLLASANAAGWATAYDGRRLSVFFPISLLCLGLILLTVPAGF